VTANGLPAGHNSLTLSWQNNSTNRTIERASALPEPGARRRNINLEMPPMPTLPPSITGHLRNLKTEARAAEQQGKLLRAGVLWHLAAEQDREDFRALAKGRELTTKYMEEAGKRGQLVLNGGGVGVYQKLRFEPQLLADTWKSLVGSVGGLNKVLLEVPVISPPNEPGDEDEEPSKEPTALPVLDITQAILHTCSAFTTQDCVTQLLVKQQATHFIVNGDGVVTQLVDLAGRVNSLDSVPGKSINIHLTVPPAKSLTHQDPDHRTSLRQYRWRTEDREVNGRITSGWGLSSAQKDALLPLLKGLSIALPGIRPVIPINMNQRETLDALVHSSEFKGVMSHSNLNRKISGCPGPGIELTHLNKHLARWSDVARSLDVEEWINDFWLDGRSRGAVLRFREVADLVLPMLVEFARELLPERARFAVQSMASRASPKAAEELAKLLVHDLPAETSGAQVSGFYGDVLDGLIKIGGAGQFDLIWAFLDRVPTLNTSPDAQIQLTHQTMATLVACADKNSCMTPFEEQLSHSNRLIRSQAAMGLLAHGGTAAKATLKPYLNDSESWIRLLAARAVGAPATTLVLDIAKDVGLVSAVHTLAHISPRKAIEEVIHWYRDANTLERHEMEQLFRQWKWMTGALVLIDRLSKTRGNTRDRILTTLQAITGRDLGSSKRAWMKWIRKQARNQQ
jgi:hypothetical protein